MVGGKLFTVRRYTGSPLYRSPPCRPQLDQSIHRVNRRRRRVGQPPQLHNGPDERLDFQRPSCFEILKHRGLVRPDGFRAGDALLDADPKRDAELFGDGFDDFSDGSQESFKPSYWFSLEGMRELDLNIAGEFLRDAAHVLNFSDPGKRVNHADDGPQQP